MIQFNLNHKDPHSKARAGTLITDHGIIETPIFMPVGTLGTVKGVHQKELNDQVRAQIILANTYHLFLRPDMDIMSKAGGIHKFINWDKPLLTDSGGYQIFSLSARRKITNEGVTFFSHIDGSKQFFTPESVVDIQRIIGSDIMMALDECTPYPCTRQYAVKSLKITKNWLERGIIQMEQTKPLYQHNQIFVPIAQGSLFEDLRQESILFNNQYQSPIYAIGGLSVGEPEEDLYKYVDICTNVMLPGSGRYLMGVGSPRNILECIALGIDFFDCVLPTRNGRHGIIYTSQGIINIRNKKWKDDFSPLDEELGLVTSQVHSKAYLRHLFMSGEMLGSQLASLQNLTFYLWLVNSAREEILKNNFTIWKDEILSKIIRRL